MSDHYSLYRWAMERQDEMREQANRRRLLRQARRERLEGTRRLGPLGRVIPFPVRAPGRSMASGGEQADDRSA